MDNNWAEVRQQMDQVLEWERAQRQAKLWAKQRAKYRALGRQQSSFVQSLKYWWQAIVDVAQQQIRTSADDIANASLRR